MWIDRVLELESGERITAVKNISCAEDHMHDHFPADAYALAHPIMPASLIVEGMAQAAGILVGDIRDFQEKVILAKITSVKLDADALPGDVLYYTATIIRIDDSGALTHGVVSCLHPRSDAPVQIGTIDLMFSHVDNNLSGLEFPDHNFVFTDDFRTLLRISDIEVRF